MRLGNIKLISAHTFNELISVPTNRWLVGFFMILVATALISSYKSNLDHHHTIEHYSHDVRERWEDSPDKHPHRMAHYGYVAFREKYPLSFFDRGLDSYLGNVVFLEAHRQNSVNFSQASFSNGLLRFGELSAGLMLQLLLSLFIFFLGYASISAERENGVLKLFLTQGAKWSDIIIGKSLSLFFIALLICIPAFVLTFILLLVNPQSISLSETLPSFFTISISYMMYLCIISFLAVWISARSQSSKTALIKLIGFWLFFTLIIPKITQVAGQVLYPTPSKISFDTTVEDELIKLGDSHDPDDPHFNALKDSLLLAHGVSSTKELPFNYSGFIMREGEKLSTMIFRKHKEELISTYLKQSQIVNRTALLNPYIAIKNISMALSGTDLLSYQVFNKAAEEYRYDLAQTMNNLQINHISNTTTSSADKGAVISQEYWKKFPVFEHGFLSYKEMISSVALSLISLFLWLIALIILSTYFTKNLKAI